MNSSVGPSMYVYSIYGWDLRRFNFGLSIQYCKYLAGTHGVMGKYPIGVNKIKVKYGPSIGGTVPYSLEYRCRTYQVQSKTNPNLQIILDRVNIQAFMLKVKLFIHLFKNCFVS